MSFEKVAGSVGHLLLNSDGAILASGGELQNDESTTKKLFKFISAGNTLCISFHAKIVD